MYDYEYEDSFINLVLASIKNSQEYDSESHKEIAIGTFKLLVDTFSIENHMFTHDITEAEYSKYFRDTTMKHREDLHDILEDEFKNNKEK